jgi:hypothetical protein
MPPGGSGAADEGVPSPRPAAGGNTRIRYRTAPDPPSRFQLRIKALSIAAVAATAAAGLLTDWRDVAGGDHVFSGARPALRRLLGAFFEPQPPPPAAQPPTPAAGPAVR